MWSVCRTQPREKAPLLILDPDIPSSHFLQGRQVALAQQETFLEDMIHFISPTGMRAWKTSSHIAEESVHGKCFESEAHLGSSRCFNSMLNLSFLTCSYPLDFKDMSACLGNVLPGVRGSWKQRAQRLIQFPPASESPSRVLILTVELVTLKFRNSAKI